MKRKVLIFLAIYMIFVSKWNNFLDNSMAKPMHKLTLVDSAEVHEVVKRIFCKGKRGQRILLLWEK